jgi:ATP phosphoribosyltransferase
VETGETLRANGLVVRDTLFEVTARVVVNRASWRLKHAAVQSLLALVQPAAGES